MSVKLTLRDKEFEVKAGMTVRHAIEACGLVPEMLLAVKDDELITEDTILKDGDQIRLIAVISGG